MWEVFSHYLFSNYNFSENYKVITIDLLVKDRLYNIMELIIIVHFIDVLGDPQH